MVSEIEVAFLLPDHPTDISFVPFEADLPSHV